MESDQETQAAGLINDQVEEARAQGSVSPDELARRIDRGAAERELATPAVTQYVTALRAFSHGAVVTTLPERIGGQFNGSSVEIAMATVTVDAPGVSETVARMEEVMRHEAYHAMHRHTEHLVTNPGSVSIIIAGEGFTETELIEGLTVAKTGDRFVDDAYRAHKQKLLRAIGSAGVSLERVESAVNRRKDVRDLAG